MKIKKSIVVLAIAVVLASRCDGIAAATESLEIE
jgi:hypothetical protein